MGTEGGGSIEEMLRAQLLETQRDKMVLLDQLAMVRVTVCFKCQNELPEMEANLKQTLERRMTRLNNLRERVVRVSDSLQSEQRYIKRAEDQLLEMKHQSAKLAKLMEQEKWRSNDLQTSLDAVKKEKSNLVNKKKLEMERLNDIRSEIGQLKGATHVVQVQSDLLRNQNMVEAMQSELKELAVIKDNIETEIFTIHEYIRLKNLELEKEKENLKRARSCKEDMEKEAAAQFEVNNRLQEKLSAAQEDLGLLKRRLQAVSEEKISILDTLAEEREVLEAAKEQAKMANEDTRRAQQLTNEVLQKNAEAKQHLHETELEQRHLIEREIKVKSNVALTKAQLEEFQELMELCQEQQKESRKTMDAFKSKMLKDFFKSREELKELNDERQRLSLEMSKANALTSNNPIDTSQEYRVQEICDTLIGGISRLAPKHGMQPVLDHIQTEFADYLRGHSISHENKSFCESRLDQNDGEVVALQKELQRKTTLKEELVKENELIEKELEEARNKSGELTDMKQKEHFELSSMEAAVASFKQTIESCKKQQEALINAAEQEKEANDLARTTSSSLEDLFKGARKGLRNPYPNLRQ